MLKKLLNLFIENDDSQKVKKERPLKCVKLFSEDGTLLETYKGGVFRTLGYEYILYIHQRRW